MMARSSKAPSIGRIQKRKTNFSKSSLSACNARPVHTDGPFAEVVRTSVGLCRQLVQQCFGMFQVKRVKAILE